MHKEKVLQAIESFIDNFDSVSWSLPVANGDAKGFVFQHLAYFFSIERGDEDYYFRILKPVENLDSCAVVDITAYSQDNSESFEFLVLKSFNGSDFTISTFHKLMGCFGFTDPADILDHVIENGKQKLPIDPGPSVDDVPF